MVGINDFIGGQKSRVDRFEKASKGKTKKERRALEQKLLKPEKIPPYTGPAPTAEGIDQFAVRIILPGRDEFDLFEKYFKVSYSVEKSVSNLALLISILESIEQGEIQYDKETGKVSTTCPECRDN